MLQPLAKIKTFSHQFILSNPFWELWHQSQPPFFLGLRPQAFTTESENILRLFCADARQVLRGPLEVRALAGSIEDFASCHCLDGRWRSAQFEGLNALWQVLHELLRSALLLISLFPGCWKKPPTRREAAATVLSCMGGADLSKPLKDDQDEWKRREMEDARDKVQIWGAIPHIRL